MPILVTCKPCQKTFQVKDEHAGRVAKCPQCRSLIKIPLIDEQIQASQLSRPVRSKPVQRQPPSRDSYDDELEEFEKLLAKQKAAKRRATACSDPKQLMREILDGFDGEFPRARPTLTYRFSALLVAMFMVLLPMIYVALIVLCGYGLYWHATQNTWILSATRGFRAGRFVVFIYLAPLVIGSLLILFLIKPLFARSAKEARELEISFSDEPILHSFIQRLCEAVNAPFPSLIEVDCEVNAAAFFRNGWWGFLRNDLGLRIGLPLLSAMNTRQVAGILAHEFGHFSQGAGMRLSYIIRSVNFWFVRVIYERDEWDEWLESWGEQENGWLTLLTLLTQMFVWISRGILWCLMMIGHGVACVLMRQMEYDADKYGTRLAGSEVFESTARRAVELSLADAISRNVIAANYELVGLPDNLPLCMSKVARELPPEMTKVAKRIIEKETTHYFASHPAHRDRIAAAHRQNASGIFRLERPAKILLNDFTKTAERATLLYYKQFLGKKAKEQMVSTEEFMEKIKYAPPSVDL